MILCVFVFILMKIAIASAIKSECISEKSTPCHADYYWRDYFNGLIPEDAVVGGRDKNGKEFYIAQALFRYSTYNEPLVTTVYPGQLTVKGLGHGTVRESNQNIKILCGPVKNNFEWRLVKSENLHEITDAHVIVGGSEVNFILFIGRIMHDGELVVGKVYDHSSPYRGIWVPQGHGQVNFLSYEVLVYKCKTLCLY